MEKAIMEKSFIEKYFKSIKLISHMIYVLAIIVTIVAVVHSNEGNEAPIGSFESEEFNEGWIITKDGESQTITLPYSGPDFYNKQVVLTNTLPSSVKNGMTICCRSDLADIKIYVGGELRANFGEETVGYVGYYPPSAYEFVALNDEDAGKEIRLEILTKKNTGYFEKVTIGYGNNSWFAIINENLLQVAMAILMIAIGAIAIVFHYFVKHKIKVNRSILFLGQSIMMLGVWIISESRLRQLLFKMPSLTQIICYLSLEILVVFVLFYFDEVQSKTYHKIYVALETINLGQLLANFALAYFRVADLHDTLKFSHMWIAVSLVPVIGFIIKDIVSGRVKKYRISAVGMAAFLVATLCELVSYYFTSAQILGVFMCVGLVILLGATITQTLVDAYRAEKRSREHVERATMTTIETIARAIDARDEYTGGHSERVAEYSAMLAQKVAAEYGFSEADIQRIHYIALMHDIGKIGIPDSILNKAERLTDEEYARMKQHAVIGYNLLKNVDTIEGLSDGVRHHHERYDGKGYPDGLAGDDIPLVAKILCIADCYDAMTSDRVYRKRLTDEQVRAELEKGAGTQFDPHLAKAFCEILDSVGAE